MKPVVCILILCALTACESTPHYNRTKIVRLDNGPIVKKPYGSVQLFQAKEEVRQAYDVLARMSVSGNAGDEAAFLKAFLYRAADLGADGLIFERVSFAGGQQGGMIAGRAGGFGFFDSSQDGFWSGEAIRLKPSGTASVQ